MAALIGKNKRLDIQGLRAIAVIAVVLFHATDLLPGGFLGVDVFFVISGFIITSLAKDELRNTGGFSTTDFLHRRASRLLPPMAIVVLVTLACGALIDIPFGGATSWPAAGLAALCGLANIYFFVTATDYFQTFQSNPLLHLWSLAVEIQFYLVFSLAVGCFLRLRRRYRLVAPAGIVGFLALMLASFLLAVFVEAWSHRVGVKLPRPFSFFMLPTRLWEFGWGIIAGTLQERIHRWAYGAWVHVLQACCAAALLGAFALGSDTTLVPGFQALAPCLATGALILTGRRGFIGAALSWRGMVFIGDRSYSIYLWQGPLVVFSSTLFADPRASLAGGLASIVIAALTFNAVEQSFRRSPVGSGWFGLPGRGIFAVGLLACTIAKVWMATALAPLAAPVPVRATALDAQCARQRGEKGIAPCVYGETGRPKALLIGDSHAGALSQAVIDAGLGDGWQVHVATASACSVPEFPETVAYRRSCEGYTADVLAYARDQQVGVVIISQFSEFYVNRLGIGETRWRQGLSAFLGSLREKGIAVLLIGDAPRLPLAAGRPLWQKEWAVDLRHLLVARRKLMELEQNVASVHASAYLRASDHLCDGFRCPVFRDGMWLYTDADHLSYRGAEPLTAPIAAQLQGLHNAIGP